MGGIIDVARAFARRELSSIAHTGILAVKQADVVDSTIARHDQFMTLNYPRYPITMVEGRGSYLTDSTGKRYLDLFSGFGAGVLEEFGVIHASGTRGHAGEATEAKIHFIAECLRRFETFVGDGAHQSDSPARAVAFEFGGVVSRAGRQAKAAMHALLHDGVVEVFEVRAAFGRI